jgi:iron complex outermembrane recepter protein
MQIRILPVLFYTSIFLLLASFCSNAQQINITLKAVTKKKEPVAFASFTAISRTDSTKQFKQTADSNGVVSFLLESGTQYMVRVSAVNFEPLEKGISISNTAKQFVFTMLQLSKTLDGVVITSKKPLMRQEEDKTIVEPENLVASSTNAYEVLEKVPGLFVDQDGNIYLSSTTPAQVYINGREMKMSASDVATMLKSLPPGSISKIEVLRTPSAKYDASGAGGIVNVVLKKGVKPGLTGTITTGINQGVYGNRFVGVNVNNNNGRLNTYINTQYGKRDNYEQIKTDRKFAPDSLLSQDAYTRYPGNYGYLGYGASYEVNKKWEIDYDGRISANHSKNSTLNQSVISKISTGNTISNSIADIDNNNRTLYTSQDFSARYKIDSIGSEWETELSYSYNRNTTGQLFSNLSGTPITTASGGDGDIKNVRNFFTAKSDLKWKFPNNFSIETGLKTSFQNYSSNTEFFRQAGGVRTKDNIRTNTFRYRENINAAYVQASKTIGGFVIKTGVRVENTNMNGRQVIPADTSFNIHRTDFFPYVYLNHKLFSIFKYPLKLWLVYRRTISRPSYEYLNPFPRFVDPYLTEIGNPALRPQFTNNMEANVSFDETPVLAVGYNHTKDIFTNVIYQADSSRSTAFRTYDNLGTNKEMYFRALGAVPPGGKYFFVMGAQYNHNFYNGLYENKPLAFKRGSWSFFTYQTLKLGKLSMLTVNAFIRLKGQQQFYELGNFGAFNTSINRQFYKKKLTVTLSVNDLFYTNNNTFTIQQGTVSASGFRQADTKRFVINLRYNFGLRKKEDSNNEGFNSESPEKSN